MQIYYPDINQTIMDDYDPVTGEHVERVLDGDHEPDSGGEDRAGGPDDY